MSAIEIASCSFLSRKVKDTYVGVDSALCFTVVNLCSA